MFVDPNALTRREAGLNVLFNDARTVVFSSHNAGDRLQALLPGCDRPG